MTTAVQPIPHAAPPGSASKSPSAPGRPASPRFLGRDVWALADQVLISGTNFVTMVLAARGLHPAAFGAFTLVYSSLLFANIFQSTLVTQPHNVLAATRHGGNYVRYTASAAFGQLLFAAAELLLALG